MSCSRTPPAVGVLNLPNRDAACAHPVRMIVYPLLGPPQGIDVTQKVVGAIAGELWRLHGGNDVLNWLEAERLLAQMMAAGETGVAKHTSGPSQPHLQAASHEDGNLTLESNKSQSLRPKLSTRSRNRAVGKAPPRSRAALVSSS